MPPAELPPKQRGTFSRIIKGALYTGTGTETIYLYGVKQRVSRIDWDRSADLEETKSCRPEYQNGTPEWRPGLGDRADWLPYQIEELALYCQGKFANWAEGEKCANALRYCGLPATTLVGSLVNAPEENHRAASEIKAAGITGIYYWPDNDEAGLEKAKKVWEACRDLGLFFVLVDLPTHWPAIGPGQDVADYVREAIKEGQNQKTIQTRLRGMVAASCGKPLPRDWFETTPAAFEADDEARYIALCDAIEQRYLPLTSRIRRQLVAGQLAAAHKVQPKLIQSIAEAIQDERDGLSLQHLDVPERGLARAPIPTGELASSQGSEYQIQGFLKKGSSMLLCALPKVGKSLLLYQMARSLAYGEDFLGRRCPTPQKILFIQAEEAAADWHDHVAAFGLLPAINSGQLVIIDRFDVMNDLRGLAYELEKEKFDIVLTDSITEISRENPASENDMEYSRPIGRMNALINRLGATHVAIHHSSKSAENNGVAKSRGTTALPGTFASVFTLERVDLLNPTRTDRRLSGGGRGSVSIDWIIDLQIGDGDIEWAFVSSKDNRSGDSSQYADRILGTLSQASFPLTTSELLDRLNSAHAEPMVKAGFFACLKEMRESGQVAYEEKPGSRPGKPIRTYSCPGALHAIAPPVRPEPVVDAKPITHASHTATGDADMDGQPVEVGRDYCLFFYGEAWDYSHLKHLQNKVVRVEKVLKSKGALVNVGAMHWIPCRYLMPDLPSDSETDSP